MLVVFLLVIAVVLLAGLYFDTAKKNRALTEEVKLLKSSQVLLMVPDEQAEDIAKWLTQHPEKTKALARKAASGESIKLTLGPGVSVSAEMETVNVPTPVAVTQQKQIVENAEGVKVIILPHGGIRVTTREAELSKKNE